MRTRMQALVKYSYQHLYGKLHFVSGFNCTVSKFVSRSNSQSQSFSTVIVFDVIKINSHNNLSAHEIRASLRAGIEPQLFNAYSPTGTFHNSLNFNPIRWQVIRETSLQMRSLSLFKYGVGKAIIQWP